MDKRATDMQSAYDSLLQAREDAEALATKYLEDKQKMADGFHELQERVERAERNDSGF